MCHRSTSSSLIILLKNLSSAEDVVRSVRGPAVSPSADTRLPSKNSVSSPPEIIHNYDYNNHLWSVYNDYQQHNPSTSLVSSPTKVKMWALWLFWRCRIPSRWKPLLKMKTENQAQKSFPPYLASQLAGVWWYEPHIRATAWTFNCLEAMQSVCGALLIQTLSPS